MSEGGLQGLGACSDALQGLADLSSLHPDWIVSRVDKCSECVDNNERQVREQGCGSATRQVVDSCASDARSRAEDPQTTARLVTSPEVNRPS